VTLYRRPGANYERIDRAGPGPVTLRTDIACFIGIAPEGPPDTPVPVESFRQFQSHFGGFTGAGYLAYAVKAFFENGGARAWIIRVASRRADLGARAAGVALAPAGAGWRAEASSPGHWGDGLEVRLIRERAVETAVDVAASSPVMLVAESVAGLERYDLVEIAQPERPDRVAVIAAVEATGRRVHLAPPPAPADPGFAYPGQSVALDPGLPARLTRVSYALDIWRDRRFRARAAGLAPVREHPRYGPALLARPDYEAAIRHDRPVPVPPPVVLVDATPSGAVPLPVVPAAGRLALTGGRDGLSQLDPGDFTGAGFDLRADAAEAFGNRQGIRALEFVDEVSIVAIPDILIRPEPDPLREPQAPPPVNPCLTCPPPPEPQSPPPAPGFADLPPQFSDDAVFRVQAALVAHCEARGDRIAVLDPPFAASRDNAESLRDVMAWRSRFDTAHAALYFPWVRAFEPRGTATMRDIPPSGHVVGRYAFHDLRSGVHRAPANAELAWIQDVTAAAGFGAEELLNDLSVNVIRHDPGRAIRIMGARTLSSDPAARHVNIRRLILMIRRAVDLLTQWVVFEPNNRDTRTRLAAVLENFLAGLFARGAFAGATAESAFFVRCDEQNNTAADRDAGRLLAEIGVAPAHPLEFVVMRVGRQGNELKIDESPLTARALP
jgi:hypothetical protein